MQRPSTQKGSAKQRNTSATSSEQDLLRPLNRTVVVYTGEKSNLKLAQCMPMSVPSDLVSLSLSLSLALSMRLAVHLHVASPIVLAQLLYIALQVWRNQVEASLGTLRAAPVAHPPQPPHMAGPNQETDRLTYRRHLRIQASASRGPSPMVGTRELGYITTAHATYLYKMTRS